MRFLFVYKDKFHLATAEIKRLNATDVKIIEVKPGEKTPNQEVLTLIGSSMPQAALCQIVKQYKKSLSKIVDIQLVVKEFYEFNKQFESWINPEINIASPPQNPRVIFGGIKKDNSKLKIAKNALDKIDQVHEGRWRFIEKAYDLLLRRANGESLGPMRDWESKFAVKFAANGPVSYIYCSDEKYKMPTIYSEWHLKEGDATSSDKAVRIYFNDIEVNGQKYTVVSYAGPHPRSGEYKVFFDI